MFRWLCHEKLCHGAACGHGWTRGNADADTATRPVLSTDKAPRVCGYRRPEKYHSRSGGYRQERQCSLDAPTSSSGARSLLGSAPTTTSVTPASSWTRSRERRSVEVPSSSRSNPPKPHVCQSHRGVSTVGRDAAQSLDAWGAYGKGARVFVLRDNARLLGVIDVKRCRPHSITNRENLARPIVDSITVLLSFSPAALNEFRPLLSQPPSPRGAV